MNHAFQTLLYLLAQMFAPRHSAQLRFLKAQVRILRRRLPAERTVPNPEEKAELLRLSREFGHDVRDVLEIAQPETYRRWVNAEAQGRPFKRSGRPRISQEVRQLVVRFGRENVLWGYQRIVGELKKLGHAIATTSVKRILLEHDVHPTPEKRQGRRPPLPWSQFIHAHLESLVACEFFTKAVHSLWGRFDAYCLVFIHLGSRRTYCSSATFSPDERWVLQQARNAAMWLEEAGLKPTMILMDRDAKFSRKFRQFWKAASLQPKLLPYRAPQANAFVEAFIGKLKHECLGHFLIFSLAQLDYVVRSWIEHYNARRPHRGIGMGNRVLDPAFRPTTRGRVRCRQRLGGIIKEYYRKAA